MNVVAHADDLLVDSRLYFLEEVLAHQVAVERVMREAIGERVQQRQPLLAAEIHQHAFDNDVNARRRGDEREFVGELLAREFDGDAPQGFGAVAAGNRLSL